MALDIDAFAVLRAIAANAATFSDIRSDAAKAAGALSEKLRALVAKQIKSKAADVSAIRDIHRALGAEAFSLVVDGMKDAELKTLVGKLDKHHPSQKTANAEWRRKHFRALVEGSMEPAVKLPGKKRATPSPKAGGKAKARKAEDINDQTDFLSDESAGAVRKR